MSGTQTISLDLVPYEFTHDGNGQWVSKDFTAFDIKVKSRFTENYQGKQVNGTWLDISHDDDGDLNIGVCGPGELGTPDEQADLIMTFFDVYFDSLLEIGYETLDPNAD